MNIYGAGCPRSGTYMLAHCLSVIKETHHECMDGRKKDELFRQQFPESENPGLIGIRCRDGEDVDLTNFIGHGSEVAFYLTFMLPRLDGKYIHIWRPVETWIPAADEFGWMRKRILPNGEIKDRSVFANLWPGDNYHERLLNMWMAFNYHLLSLDAYRIRADKIDWEDLLNYLEWDYEHIQLDEIKRRQWSYPNNGGDYDPVEIQVDLTEAFELQSELERTTNGW